MTEGSIAVCPRTERQRGAPCVVTPSSELQTDLASGVTIVALLPKIVEKREPSVSPGFGHFCHRARVKIRRRRAGNFK